MSTLIYCIYTFFTRLILFFIYLSGNLKEDIMKILNGVLNEELDRLNQLKKNYEIQIVKLPKGSLIRKNIKGNMYYYLNYRQGKKKIFKYIGKLPSKELENLLDKIEERRKLEKLNNQVKKDIKKLEKMIK
jgi:hypothetical protein